VVKTVFWGSGREVFKNGVAAPAACEESARVLESNLGPELKQKLAVESLTVPNLKGNVALELSHGRSPTD